MHDKVLFVTIIIITTILFVHLFPKLAVFMILSITVIKRNGDRMQTCQYLREPASYLYLLLPLLRKIVHLIPLY